MDTRGRLTSGFGGGGTLMSLLVTPAVGRVPARGPDASCGADSLGGLPAGELERVARGAEPWAVKGVGRDVEVAMGIEPSSEAGPFIDPLLN